MRRFSVADKGPAAQRRAFTLLELILALSLGVILLGALYLTLSTHYHHARAGREIIDETVSSRFVLLRIAQDIACQLAPLDPRVLPEPGAGGTDAAVVFNLGVFGQEDRLVLTGRGNPSPNPLPLGEGRERGEPGQTLTCDLRRVAYWLVRDGDQVKGLARQELARITGAEADSLPPDVPDPESFIIAPEVKKLVLEYHDGTAWQTSWDGSAQDEATARPKGPPAAIAVTITLVLPDHGAPKIREVTYRHVVAIPAANSFAPNQANMP